MDWLWGKKSPQQMVAALSEDLNTLLSEDKDVSLVAQVISPEDSARGRESPPPEAPSEVKVAIRIRQIKLMFIGEEDISDKEKQELSISLTTCMTGVQYPVIKPLILSLDRLPFESRKHVQQIFSFLMRRSTAAADAAAVRPSMDPILVDPVDDATTDCLAKLVAWCASPLPGIPLTCGLMLRDAIRSEAVVHHLFSKPERYIWPFFESEPGSATGGLLDALKFDLASDAFATLRELLTRHKHIAKDFLENRYTDLFGDVEPDSASPGAAPPTPPPQPTPEHRYRLYDALLKSTNYVTRRQSLKLLGELLLDRNNFTVMMRFISSKRNLKQMMILLRDESKSIQFEAFHVFKVFVANPRKPDTIIGTLVRNQTLLIQYLEAFHPEKQEPQFLEEKSLIIETIRGLAPVSSG